MRSFESRQRKPQPAPISAVAVSDKSLRLPGNGPHGAPRITRIGSLLRRTSLDDLPRLFNVLGGSMSPVGPRPHAMEHQTCYQHLVDKSRCRHRMKPGITGWAQTNGRRGETTTDNLMKKRVEYDLSYIEYCSILFDIWILVLTPFCCIWGKNGY